MSSTSLRILITGSRTWENDNVIDLELDRVRAAYLGNRIRLEMGEAVLVHGGAVGADMLAERVAEEYGMVIERHKPRYDLFPRNIAPLKRNDYMVSLGADICVAFRCNGSSGTTYTINKALSAGIPTLVREEAELGFSRVFHRTLNTPDFLDNFELTL